jgi:hypothetical protein
METGDISMSKLDFQKMTLKELRSYVLSNQEEKEAFYAFVDRLHAEKEWTTHPPLKSMEDMENYPDFLEKLRRDPGRKI